MRSLLSTFFRRASVYSTTMSASTRIDINYLSVGSDNAITLFAGSPAAHIVNQPLSNFTTLSPDSPGSYASIAKFSGAKGIKLSDVNFSQGRENSVDINNGANNIELSGHFGRLDINNSEAFIPDQVITIKGGSKNVIVRGIIHSHGDRCEIQIGNWSDQSYDNSTNITLDLTSSDGKPVIVQVGHAKNVTLLGDCKLDKWGSLKLKAYWWLKRIVRAVMRIPVGTKGPSWM